MARCEASRKQTNWLNIMQNPTMTGVMENKRTPHDSTDLPWQRGRVLLWICAGFALLFALTVLLVAPAIQQKLDTQSKQRLVQAGINPGSLELDWNYRDLTVRGFLPDNVSFEQLASVLRGSEKPSSTVFAEGIRHLRLDVETGGVLPTDEPMSVAIRGDNLFMIIDGVVQDEAQRTQIVSAAIESGVDNITDNLEVNGELPTASVKARIDLLSSILRNTGPEKIKRTEVKLSEADLYYRITASDKHSAQAIERAAAVNIQNLSITGGVDIFGQSQLDLSVVANGETITLNGSVRDENQRKRLVFSAGEAVGARNVVDQLAIDGSLSSYSDHVVHIESVAAIIARFAPGINGKIRLKGTELVVDAQTGSDAIKDYLSSSVSGAKSAGLTVTENINVQLASNDAQELQTQLDRLIDEVRDSVVFTSGNSELSDSAKQTLDKVAKQIATHDSLLVEIEGHTDNVGRSNINEQLSQSRANAVRSYLAQSNIDGSRLIAVGYGHRQPIESNDTAEGRQANRRVHFSVLTRPEN